MKRTLFTFLFLGIAVLSWSQNYKRLMKQADKWYEIKAYAKAIPLYEKAQLERETKAVKYRLAYAYQMTNQIDEASSIYQSLLADDSKKINPKIYFNYSKILLYSEEYDEAKSLLERYVEEKPRDEEARLLLENIDKIGSISPQFGEVSLEPFTYNSDADDHAPIFYKNGIIFASDRDRQGRIFEESAGWTGRDFINLYHSYMLEDGEFEVPNLLPRKINSMNKNVGSATFALGDSLMIFSRNSEVTDKQNNFKMQLYSAEFANGKWDNIKLLSFCNPGVNYMHPSINEAGDTLVFVTDRGSGEGGTDLYIATFENGKWSKMENLGAAINTPMNEGFPFLHESGDIYFCSQGLPGYGGFDIFVVKKEENNTWGTPINLGKPINSSSDDIGIVLDADCQSGFLTTNRDGADDDIFLINIGERKWVKKTDLETND